MSLPIREVLITNYQAHRKTSVALAQPGRVTVVTGPSDSGKTAILRAMRWLYYNEPAGMDMLRIGAEDEGVSVAITYEDDTVVRRVRSKNVNRYLVERPDDSEPTVFEGFGNAVPLEVQQRTGVRRVLIGDFEVLPNLARQLEAPFLGSGISAPLRARILGKLAGAEVFDQAGKRVASDVLGASQERRRLEAQAHELQGQLARYHYLPALAAHLERLRELAGRLQRAEQDRDKRIALHAALSLALRQQAAATERLRQAAHVAECLAPLVRRVESALPVRTSLQGIADRRRRTDTHAGQVAGQLARLPDVERLRATLARATPLVERQAALIRLRDRRRALDIGVAAAERTLAATAPAPAVRARIAALSEMIVHLGEHRRLRDRLHLITYQTNAELRRHSDQVQVAAILPLVQSAEQCLQERQAIAGIRQRVVGQLQAIHTLAGQVADLRRSEQEARAKRRMALQDVLSGGQCPTCGQAVTETHLHQIEEALA